MGEKVQMNRHGHGMSFSIVNLVALILLLPLFAVPGLAVVPFHETAAEGPLSVVLMAAWVLFLIYWHIGLWKRHRWAGVLPGIFYLALTGLFCWLSNAGY